VLGQEYNRPAEADVLKKPRGSDFNFNFNHVMNSNNSNWQKKLLIYWSNKQPRRDQYKATVIFKALGVQ
jgi:hypothetical protein